MNGRGLIGAAAVLFAACWPAASTAAAPGAQPDLLRSELVAERAVIAPGQTVTVAVRQRIAPGWHTYWRNPGKIGQATRVTWTLPDGWRAGEIAWPTPQVYRLGSFVSFVYADEVLLPAPITAPAGVVEGPVRLKAEVASLLCRDVCVPARETLFLDLRVASASGPPTPEATAIHRTLGGIAGRSRAVGVYRVDGDRITVAAPGVSGTGAAAFFPNEGQGVDTDGPASVGFGPQGATITLMRSPAAIVPTRLEGVLARTGEPDVAVTASPGAIPGWAKSGSVQPTWKWSADLAGAILLALAGGAILNVMPCVFPILAGKVAAAASAGGSRSRLRREALAYAGGTLAAFLALAATLIAVRAAGHAAGWGFQLQSPAVVAGLAMVMVASALNLAGVFEAGLFLQRAGGRLRLDSSDAGAFLTGALAAVVAAPCTAPLMAPAIGWALTQPPAAALAVFAALGLGLAIPFVVLAWTPGAERLLPCPGRWLAGLRQVLAFPMLGGAAWLIWIFAMQRGAQSLPGLFAALISVAFGLWCWGASQRSQRAWRWRIGAAAALVAVAPAGLANGLSGKPASQVAIAEDERWTPERVRQLQAEGRPVLVDVTAAWCVTCQVNQAAALDHPDVRAALQRTGGRILKADWTRPDPAIEQLLAEHGRSGVPFYLLHAADGRVIELPQILTPQIVAQALARAQHKET